MSCCRGTYVGNRRIFLNLLSSSASFPVLPVEQTSCWTMFSAEVLTRPSSPVHIMEWVYTTVTIPRMWWSSVAVMVIEVACQVRYSSPGASLHVVYKKDFIFGGSTLNSRFWNLDSRLTHCPFCTCDGYRNIPGSQLAMHNTGAHHT